MNWYCLLSPICWVLFTAQYIETFSIKNALNSEHVVGVTKMGSRYFYIFAYVKHYYQQVKFGRTYFFKNHLDP